MIDVCPIKIALLTDSKVSPLPRGSYKKFFAAVNLEKEILAPYAK